MYNLFEEYVKHTSVKYPRILPKYTMIMCLQLEQLRWKTLRIQFHKENYLYTIIYMNHIWIVYKIWSVWSVSGSDGRYLRICVTSSILRSKLSSLSLPPSSPWTTVERPWWGSHVEYKYFCNINRQERFCQNLLDLESIIFDFWEEKLLIRVTFLEIAYWINVYYWKSVLSEELRQITSHETNGQA